MHIIQSFGGNSETYDNNAYTITSTYHDGTLKLYTTHPTRPVDAGNAPEYHMTQLNSWSLTGNLETFRQGASAFRNARDWAKEQRDGFIAVANSRATDMDMDASTLEISRDNSKLSFSTNGAAALESDTSTDELALDAGAMTEPPSKRVKRGPSQREGPRKSHSQCDRPGRSGKRDSQSDRRRGPKKSHSKSDRRSAGGGRSSQSKGN